MALMPFVKSEGRRSRAATRFTIATSSARSRSVGSPPVTCTLTPAPYCARMRSIRSKRISSGMSFTDSDDSER